jgi:hypothetical protein
LADKALELQNVLIGFEKTFEKKWKKNVLIIYNHISLNLL